LAVAGLVALKMHLKAALLRLSYDVQRATESNLACPDYQVSPQGRTYGSRPLRL
jgi:hypothetical protein